MRLTGFEGRTALVTGGAGGVGLAVVAALREAGATVCATDRAKAVAAMQPVDGVIWRALDVCDPDGVAALLADRTALPAPPSLVVHAAGVLETGPMLDTDPAAFQRIMDVNAGGTFNLLTAAGRAMTGQGGAAESIAGDTAADTAERTGGAIVVIGSNAGGIPRHGMAAYAASKAAAAMLTRCLGLELAAHGVRCNLVAPGSTLTPMLRGMWADDSGAEATIAGDLSRHRTGIPLGKLATPQDIAAAAMFLLSDQAGHVTMADLYVDGGATLRA